MLELVYQAPPVVEHHVEVFDEEDTDDALAIVFPISVPAGWALPIIGILRRDRRDPRRRLDAEFRNCRRKR